MRGVAAQQYSKCGGDPWTAASVRGSLLLFSGWKRSELDDICGNNPVRREKTPGVTEDRGGHLRKPRAEGG